MAAVGLGACPATGGAGCVAGLIGGIAVFVGGAITGLINMVSLNSQLGDVQEYLLETFNEVASAAQP